MQFKNVTALLRIYFLTVKMMLNYAACAEGVMEALEKVWPRKLESDQFSNCYVPKIPANLYGGTSVV